MAQREMIFMFAVERPANIKVNPRAGIIIVHQVCLRKYHSLSSVVFPFLAYQRKRKRKNETL